MPTRKATEADKMRALKPLMERTAVNATTCADMAWDLNLDGIAMWFGDFVGEMRNAGIKVPDSRLTKQIAKDIKART